MSQYIAEVLVLAERADADQRDAAQSRCATAILDLWAHRADLPVGARPFEDLEGVVLTLRALRNDDTPFYSQHIRWLGAAASTIPDAAKPLASARIVDAAARAAMRYFVDEATCILKGDSASWIDIASAIPQALSPEVNTMAEILVSVAGEQESVARRRHLADQIDYLESLQSSLGEAVNRLKANLASLPMLESHQDKQ